MPLLEPILDDGLTVALWRVTESEQVLAGFTQSNIELPANHERRLERLATMALLKSQGLPIVYSYDKWGRPFFADSDVNFSVSHTNGLVAVAYSSDIFVGIDVERISRNFERVLKKILTAREACHAGNYSQEHLALIWSAKEAIYKLPWEKKLVFSRDIEVLVEVEQLYRGWIFSRVRDVEGWDEHIVKYRFFDNFCLTWVTNKK